MGHVTKGPPPLALSAPAVCLVHVLVSCWGSLYSYGMTQSSDSHLSLPLILSCVTRLCTADNMTLSHAHACACTCTCGITSDHIIWSPWIKLVSWLLGCLAVCVCWREREESLWWNLGQPLFSKLPPFQSHCLCKFIFLDDNIIISIYRKAKKKIWSQISKNGEWTDRGIISCLCTSIVCAIEILCRWLTFDLLYWKLFFP